MTSVTPPIDLHEHMPKVEMKAQRRRPSRDDDRPDLESLEESSKHLQDLRNNHTEDEDDTESDSSSTSASSTDSLKHKSQRHQHQHSKSVKSKHSRGVKPRSFSASSQSTMSSSTDSYLPSLSRILEGRPSRQNSLKSNASTTSQDKGKPRPYAKHSSAKSARAGRHHGRSQSELQPRTRSLTSPSLQSVMSSLTAATSSSSGSNGSNSTVTQSSYTQSETSKGGSDQTAEHKSPTDQAVHKKRRRRKERHDAGQPDVFAFIEEEPPGTDGTTSESDSEARDDAALRPQTPAMQAHRSSADPFMSPKPMRIASWASHDQLHSDSGISVRGSSPESIGRRESDKQLAVHRAEGEYQSKSDGTTTSSRGSAEVSGSWQRRWSSASTGSTHPSAYLHQQGYPPMSVAPYAQPPPPPAYPGQAGNTARDLVSAQQHLKPSGYDLIASRLSNNSSVQDGRVKPLYRRFGRLNHRILLHLQDEIAEMEEQLQVLDGSLARCKPMPDSPESRRSEARYVTELTYQRTEVLGRIFVKIKQYNEALASFNAVSVQTHTANSEDIECYRNFAKKVKPVAPEELRFLDRSEDLVDLSVPAPDPVRSVTQRLSRPITTMPSLLLGPPAAMLVAFVMFSAASGWIVRLFLLGCFSGAGYVGIYLTGIGRDLMADQERQVCLGFYVCLLACIAATAG